MATFSQVAKGGTQRRPIIDFPLIDGTMLKGSDCAVIPILGDAEGRVLKGAREYAIEQGLTDPKETDPIYKFGRAIWICALGTVDNDPKVPEGKPVLFFDGGVKQIREHLDRDRIFFLARQQEAWQSELSPCTKNITSEDLSRMLMQIKETPEGVELPLECWPLATQRIFIRSVVNTLLTLTSWLSASGSNTPAAGQTSSDSAKSSTSSDGDDAAATKTETT